MGPVSTTADSGSDRGLFTGVTAYHWLVVIIASCGWLFDCMDQRLFILARQPALTELVSREMAGRAEAGQPADTATTGQASSLAPAAASPAEIKKKVADLVKKYGGWATTSMILGWATGGIIFGMMSDKWGRVKTMAVTLLVYSGFTGLSGLAQTWEQFIGYRFLVGLGVGGMFGAATTLVAESVPGGFRAVALGSLQALSATGNITGSLISLAIPPSQAGFWGDHSGWRVLFFVGILPALLVIPIVFILREPDAWKLARQQAAATGTSRSVGSPGDLFRDPRWRRNATVGLLLGLAGMVGLWGIAFFSPELIAEALQGAPQASIDNVKAWGTALQDAGAFVGMMVFTWVAAAIGRRKAFFGAFVLCIVVVDFVFYFLRKPVDAYWMLPLLGFATLTVFAGYSIYFPELFPTRLRGTGVGFCYNTVRYLAAPAPALFGWLSTQMPFRTVALLMSAIFLLGFVALIWAPETKGKPLPED
jgi:MFS family permease